MRNKILAHMRRMQAPGAIDQVWGTKQVPPPPQEQPAPPPEGAQGGGGDTLGKGALESFLGTNNEELNPEAPLEATGALGAPTLQGRFSDTLRRRRMANEQSQKQARGELSNG
jgi:hypothetical protein